MDHEKTRADLESKLATLTARVAKIEGHLRDPGNPDWQEQASERQNDEVLEHLDQTELREIEEIRGALARMADGSYGRCAVCGEPIGEGRLEALPYTSQCIGCAE